MNTQHARPHSAIDVGSLALFAVAAVAAVATCATRAGAFNLETSATDGCHEQITRTAIERAGWPAAAQPPSPSPDDDALARALPFSAEGLDPWTVALLVGARDNDLHGTAPTDLDAFAAVHQSAAFQEEHCLRSPDDDGDGADARAIARCRAFILDELALALGSNGDRVDGGDIVDLDALTPVRVALVDGTRDVPLSRYAFHLGRAAHALQDSFTHALREEDRFAVQHVLNYVDPATDRDYDPDVDGHPHQGTFDSCDVENFDRVDAAIEATSSLFAAAAFAGTTQARLTEAAAVLDRELVVDDACTVDNRWCDSLGRIPPGCNAAGASTSMLALLGMLLALATARRRARRFVVCAVGVVCALVPRAALADGPSPILAAPIAATTEARPFALAASGGVAFDKGGALVSVGGRWRLSPLFSVGCDLEFNPWFDLLSGSALPGVANASARGTVHWLAIDGVGVESTASLGASALLFDAVGANAGDVGPYMALSAIGARVPMGDRMVMLVEPAKLVVAVPHLGGVPLAYRQYSAGLGVEWAL